MGGLRSWLADYDRFGREGVWKLLGDGKPEYDTIAMTAIQELCDFDASVLSDAESAVISDLAERYWPDVARIAVEACLAWKEIETADGEVKHEEA